MLAPVLLAVALAATPSPARGERARGAGAKGAPALELAPTAVRPGDAVLVRVLGAGAATPSGTLADRPLEFWRAGREWRALAALPLETPLGRAAAEVVAGAVRLEGAVDVVEPGFAKRTLTVAPGFVEPPPELQKRIAGDRRAMAEAQDLPFAPPLFRGDFAYPRKAGTTGRFGDARVFNGTQASVHYGLDLTGPRGAPVHAANDGEVALVRDAYMSGRTVVLWHGAGIYTLYFHLDRIEVSKGARVKRGQRIGRLGSTGRSTGPHLHWSAKVDGLYVDPESLLALDLVNGTGIPRTPARAPAPAPAPSASAPEPAPAEAPAGVHPDSAAAAAPATAPPAPGR
jgi:murein DD-endopeptidase MepM/ murein hydrolase activator NlpD